MGRASSIKRLPPEVRTTFEGWLKEFLASDISLDQVVERLEELLAFNGLDPALAPSRSAVHRYSKTFEAVVQRVQRSRELTDLLAEQLGPAVADGRGVQVMIQGVQGLTYDLLASIEDGTSVDPKTIHDLAKAAHHMAAAQKTDADRALKIEAEVLKKAAAAAKAVGRELGWSKETAETVRARILGIGQTK